MSGQGKPMGNERRLYLYATAAGSGRKLSPKQMRRSVQKVRKGFGTNPTGAKKRKGTA